MPACEIGGEVCSFYVSPVGNNGLGCPAGFLDTGVIRSALAEAVQVAIKGVTRDPNTGKDAPSSEALYEPSILGRQVEAEYGLMLKERVSGCKITVANFGSPEPQNYEKEDLPTAAATIAYRAMKRLKPNR